MGKKEASRQEPRTQDGHYIQRRREKAPLCPAPHSLWTLLYGRIAAVRSACMAGGLRTLRAS